MHSVKEEQLQFFKKNKRLEIRKKKLFQIKDITKWEIGVKIDPAHLTPMLENKDIAFPYMLTKVRWTLFRTRKI